MPCSPTESWTTDSTKSLLDYDEEDVVNHLLSRLGLQRYAETFQVNGIDGAALAHLDHASLRELGICSLGHRLNILKTIYECKKSEGIPLEEGDWAPPIYGDAEAEPLTAKPSPPPDYSPAKSRSSALEAEVSELRSDVDTLQELVHSLADRFLEAESALTELKKTRPTSVPQAKPALSVDTAKATGKVFRAFSSPNRVKSPRKTPEIETLRPWQRSPPKGTSDMPKSAQLRRECFDEIDSSISPLRSAARSGRIFDSEVMATTPMLGTGVNASISGSSSGIPPLTTALIRPAAPTRSNSARSAKSSSDTCMTILPAAVRKYRLKSEWTQYVMIVSCASHKRALSYDERPRVVVEELRLKGEKPSCLVQHQSELRSPLALAHSRRTKLFKRHLASTNGTSAEAEDVLLQHIPVPANDEPRATFANSATFGLAIYPYQAELGTETDLEYGMLYTLSLANEDFATVQRLFAYSTGIAQTGVVPRRCLLELHHATDSIVVSPTDKSSATTGRATARMIQNLDADNVVTPFVMSHALLDRASHGAGEIALEKGDELCVYYRCAHWSFALLARTGEAGWVPTWLIASGTSSISPREVAHLPTQRLAM